MATTVRVSTFSAAPTKQAPAPAAAAAPVASVADATVTAAAAAASAKPAAAATTASDPFQLPSWPEGHPNNPYKSAPKPAAAPPAKVSLSAAAAAAAARPATALRASAFVKQLAGKKRAVSSSDSDSDSDADDAGGFMRSTSASEEALQSQWLAARPLATHDFKSKNKSAVRRSGLNVLGSGAGGAGAGAGAGALQRSTTERAIAVLESSEGRTGGRNKKRQRH